MEIKELGEFGLIDRIARSFTNNNPSTVLGIGDDAAVINAGDNHTLVTTDMLMEGINFDLTYIDMEHLGYKAAVTGISDILAMNGTPTQLLVSVALGKRFKVEDVDALYNGIRRACDKWHVDLVGGDTSASYTGLAITVTAMGLCKPGDEVKRSGANVTDIVCVTGDLGAAYMGLQLLEREKSVYYGKLADLNKKMKEAEANGDKEKLQQFTRQRSELNDFQPDFAGREYLLQRELQPEAPSWILEKLREAGVKPTAMMDITDGLSSELHHICSQSHCGCHIYENKLPIDYQTAVMAEELNMNVSTCALNGGDDYEMLFTVPVGDYEKVKGIDGLHQVGYITKEELGMKLVTRDGNEFDLTAQGWKAE